MYTWNKLKKTKQLTKMAKAITLNPSSTKDKKKMLGVVSQLWEVTWQSTVNKGKIIMHI